MGPTVCPASGVRFPMPWVYCCILSQRPESWAPLPLPRLQKHCTVSPKMRLCQATGGARLRHVPEGRGRSQSRGRWRMLPASPPPVPLACVLPLAVPTSVCLATSCGLENRLFSETQGSWWCSAKLWSVSLFGPFPDCWGGHFQLWLSFKGVTSETVVVWGRGHTSLKQKYVQKMKVASNIYEKKKRL